jgi:hypothetical protein
MSQCAQNIRSGAALTPRQADDAAMPNRADTYAPNSLAVVAGRDDHHGGGVRRH